MPGLSDWEALAVKVGTVTRCEINDGAREAAYRLWIDMGDPDPAQSSAKLTDRYRPADLVGRQVVAVTGLAPVRVGGFRSDVLVVGVETDDGVVLLSPGRPVSNGSPVT